MLHFRPCLKSFSFSCDNSILLNSHVCADSAEVAWLIRFRLESPNSLPERKWESVVIGLNLGHCDCGLLTDCSNRGVLWVKPRSLNIGVLLWITFVAMLLRKVLSSKAWNCAHLLLFQRSCVTSGGLVINFLEISSGLLRWFLCCLAVEIALSCIEWTLIMSGGEAIDNWTEASLSATNGAIDKRKFSNIILINHAENWSLLMLVHRWVSQVILLRGNHLTL